MRFSKNGGVGTPSELKQVSWTDTTGCLLSTRSYRDNNSYSTSKE